MKQILGKSTLLRMMAGLEPPSNGEVLLMPSYTRGILLDDALGEFPTHILAWEGGADWFWFEGNFAAYRTRPSGSARKRPARTGSLQQAHPVTRARS